VGFVVDKVALGQVFPLSTSVFPCRFHSTGAPLLGKGQKKIIIFIFIVGLHNKPQGCGASVPSAAGPFTTKKKTLYQSTCYIILEDLKLQKYCCEPQILEENFS
jgi:DNA-directed RNA polymerase subunit N (RpoN/RPB10)